MKEEKFNCKKCGISIGGHNQFLHDGMCDNCFFEIYFPDEAQIFETDIEQIKIHCRSKPIERENMKFWQFLKSDELDHEAFQKIVKEITEKIDCAKCANCCKALKAVLNELDINRISKHLNLSKDEFILKHLAKNESNGFEFKQKPCFFLMDNKCQIYNERPDVCKDYPHLNKDISFSCHSFFSNAEICPIVFNVLENAKEAFLEDIYRFENPDE